jgi:Dolichyl-phosphate-mannose-protein mannosyltransferase
LRIVAAAAAAAGAGLLLARIVGDVGGKPLFEDEAVSGLIAARPLGEILVTILWDRGGAPLHALLVHLGFVFDSSPEALRWISVVFALATVPVTFDLGRRLGGPVAGGTAALVASTSGMLAIYGSFGRMYALLAFAGALAADLFLRALELRTPRAAGAAAAAAWLLPAVHPYGGIVVAVEALVALALWRGRPLRAALPAALAGLAMIPFVVADLRLASRFEVSGEQEGRLATQEEARHQLASALRGFAGGEGLLLALFVTLAVAGLVLVAHRQPAFAAFAVVSFLAPPLLATLVRTGRAPDLSPRHLIFALPVLAACVGVAATRGTHGVPRPVQALAVAGVGVAAALAPQGIPDPRTITYTAALGGEESVAEPAAFLRREIRPGDVLYPYASVFLAALPEAGEASGLPRAQGQSLLAATKRLDYPVGVVWVAVPTGTTEVANVQVAGARQFGSWLLVRAEGPFPNRVAVLRASEDALAGVRPSLREPIPDALDGWFELNQEVLCESIATLGGECDIRP